MPGLFKTPKPPPVQEPIKAVESPEVTAAKKSTAEDRKRQQRRARVVANETETLG